MLWKQQSKGRPPARRLHYAMLPHEMLHAVYEKSNELFQELFTGGQDNLRNWWSQAEAGGGTWASGHPVLALEPDPCKRIHLVNVKNKITNICCRKKRIPFGVHGDDAGAQGEETVLVVTWGSVAVELPTMVLRAGF